MYLQPCTVYINPHRVLLNSRFAIGDHENLFVAIFTPPEQIHSWGQTGHRVGVIWPYLQMRNVFYGNTSVIPKSKTSKVSLGYRVVMNSARAMATFLAGVIRSSLWIIL